MSVLANTGPLVLHRNAPLGSVVGTWSQNTNPHEGMSLEHIGSGLLDPRVPFTYQPGMGDFVGGNFGTPAYYGFSGGDYLVMDCVPSAASLTNIAAQQTTVTQLNLVTTSSNGIQTGISIVRADTGVVVTGLLSIDNPANGYPFGMAGLVNAWDPLKTIARGVSLQSAGNDSGINFTVNGYDVYGYPMSQTLAGGNIATVTTTKAFKYISTITHTGAIAGAGVNVGASDVIGLPLRSDTFSDITAIFWNSVYITSSATGYVAAVQTNPSTASTGDVRGTVNLATLTGGAASNGTLRLTIYQSPKVYNIAGGQVQTVTVTVASPAVFTLNGHGFLAGQPLQFITTGGLPTGLTPSTFYYVISAGLTANNFEVSTAPNGAAVNTSGSQNGTHSCISYGTSNFVNGMFGITQNLASNNGY